jgi:uncharacterized protein (DUF2249 family)
MAEHGHLEAYTMPRGRSSITSEGYHEARPLLEPAPSQPGPVASPPRAPASLVHPSPEDHQAPRSWWELDLGDFPRSHHTSVVFEGLDCLGQKGRLFVACPYPPETLRGQIEAWCPDAFRWTWIADGPVVWRAKITPTH